MKRKKIILVSGVVLLTMLIGLKFRSKKIHLECPQKLQATTSNLVLPSVDIALKATLEILNGENVVQTSDIGVQLVSKQANRLNSPLLIQLSQIQIDNLAAGTYNFVVTLKRQTDNLRLATLRTSSNIQAGSSINFDQAQWDFDVDEPDTDGYNNITEILNGTFETPPGTSIANLWVSANSLPADSASKPAKVKLLRPSGIAAMAPGPEGKLRISGDPFSVQPGVYVKANLLNAQGIQKSSMGVSARIDGSFDLNFAGGAVSGDRVLVYTISRKDRENGLTEFDSSRSDVGPNSKVELVVRDLQGCQ